jgi:hypothetical protein
MGGWSIPLETLVDRQRDQLEAKARKIAFEAFSRVIYRSPVRTGHFRASWVASEGAPGVSGTSTNIASSQAEAAKALTFKIGGVWYFSNSLPYAQRLEYGYSRQAPMGIVRLTVLEMKAWISNGLR